MHRMTRQNHNKPPLTVEESQRLLDGAQQQELNKTFRAGNAWMAIGILKVVGVIALAGILFYALGGLIGTTAAIVVICFAMYLHDRVGPK
jgi:hypothetical protein